MCGGGDGVGEGGGSPKNPSRLRTGNRRQTEAASPHEAPDSAAVIRAAATTCEGKKDRVRGFSVTGW